MSPRENWLERYRKSSHLLEPTRDILVGFNANIDEVHKIGDLDLELDEVEPEKREEVSSPRGFKSALKYYMEKGENREVQVRDLDHEFEDGKQQVGGQAGIIANYLSSLGNGVIFYTPFLSQELADNINENVLYPVSEDGFKLKNVRDAANTDRTKKNLIFEYENGKTGRVIFSSTLKGFGPYFRKGIEDNFPEIEQNIDRVILSGFHDVEGNREAKLKKARDQIEKLQKPVHLEFVHRSEDLTRLIARHVLSAVQSVGLDEDELRFMAETLDMDVELEQSVSLGHAFNALKKLIERFELERVHLHTYSFQLAVATEEYETPVKSMRDAMLFGELSAVKTAEKGDIPGPEDFGGLSMDDKHLRDIQELEDFGDFFDLENFSETGTAEVDGYRVAAIPVIIHEDPERLVGTGDIISSGAFMAELN